MKPTFSNITIFFPLIYTRDMFNHQRSRNKYNDSSANNM